MKKSLKCLIAATASVVSSAAFASSNMENPLYMPKNREVYLKTGAAVMYKEADSTEATKKRQMDGKTEFPIWRFSGDIGYGIQLKQISEKDEISALNDSLLNN